MWIDQFGFSNNIPKIKLIGFSYSRNVKQITYYYYFKIYNSTEQGWRMVERVNFGSHFCSCSHKAQFLFLLLLFLFRNCKFILVLFLFLFQFCLVLCSRCCRSVLVNITFKILENWLKIVKLMKKLMKTRVKLGKIT